MSVRHVLPILVLTYLQLAGCGAADTENTESRPPDGSRDGGGVGTTAGSSDAGLDAALPPGRDAALDDASGPQVDSGPTLPFNDTDAQLETFWATYGGRDKFPASYAAAVEAMLRAEDEVDRGDFGAARARVAQIFKDYPFTTSEWWAGVGKDGTNVGTPVAYYGLRMLDEITARADAASSVKARTIRLTVVMPRCAQGTRPTSADLTTGESVSLSLDPALAVDDHRIIRQSLRLFQHYVWAITGGALRVEPAFQYVENCVSVVYRSNPSYSGITDANAAIEEVPEPVQTSTDMWWVLYPSNVPAGAVFDQTAFITGGMGGRGRAPLFIIDDLWLVRKPAHLGRGSYTDVERRVYLPQWLQHEFFHHLFRTWPELALEATGHQWFDRKTWPADFVGEWEPDYYAEALRKRLYAADPSLARALRVALPEFDTSVFKPQDFVGSYQRLPVENGWHSVTISLDADQLVWRNAAAVQWNLTWANGSLKSAPDSPYGQQMVMIEPRLDANGDALPQIRALYLNGEAYLRL